jgi:PAS domain S-box-containing protein
MRRNMAPKASELKPPNEIQVTTTGESSLGVLDEKETLAALVNSIQDEIWFADTKGYIRLANPAARREFSLEAGKPVSVESLAKTLETCRPDGTPRPVSEAPVLRALKGAVVLDEESITRIPATGEWRHRQTSAAPVIDGNGAIAGAVAVARDVTDRKRVENRLRADLNALNRIRTLSERLLDPGGLQPLLQEIMSAAVEIMGAERGTLQLLEGDSLHIVAHYGHQQPFLDFFASAETRASVCGEATWSGERVIVPDVENSLLFAGTPSLQVLKNAGVRAVQSTPMRNRRGDLLGILTTQWGIPYSPDEHDLWRLDLLVRQAADLIELAKGEKELRESEDKYRGLFDNMNEMVIVSELLYDDQGNPRDYRILDVNPAYLRKIGRARNEIVGRRASDVYGTSVPAHYLDLFAQVVQMGKPVQFEACFEPLELQIIVSAIHLGGTRYATVNTDITKRKRSEEALRSANERIQNLLSCIMDVHIVLDPQWRYTYVNEAAVRSLGMTREQILGHSLWELHPDTLGTEFERRCRDAMERRVPVVFEYHYPETDTWWENRFYPVAEGLSAFATDITERKHAERALSESEARLRGILDNLQDAYLRADLSGHFTMLSPSAVQMFGYDSIQEMLGLSAETLYADTGERAALLEAVRRLGRVNDWISQGKRKDGSTFWISMTVQVCRSSTGEIVGTEGVVRDITERRKAEQETARLASFPILNPNPIIEADPDGNVLFANPTAQKLFPDLQANGRKHPFLVDWDNVWNACQHKAGLNEREVIVGERWYFQTIHCILEAQRIRIYSLDITARKRTEKFIYAIASVDKTIHSILDSREIMRLALAQAVEASGCETAAISLREGERWLVSYVHGLPESSIGRYMVDEEEPHALLAIRTGKVVAIDDAFSDSRVNGEHMRQWGVRSVLVVPLRVKDNPLGVLSLNYHQKAVTFELAHLNFAERLASTLSLALENSHLFESLKRSKEELEERVRERTEELKMRVDQLRALAGELTLTEQRERRRLAKILHDHLQQLLVGAKFRLTVLGRGKDDVLNQAIKEIEGLIDESIKSSRSLTAELSPPILHDAGLNAGLEWLARRMADTQGLFVELTTEQVEHLSDDLTILLFESVRELLFNVVKHAQARSAHVNLRRIDGSLQLTVSDQGVGFDLNAMPTSGDGRFGLFGVRERLELFGGKLEINSTPGRGSRLVICVPMSKSTDVEPQSTEVAGSPEQKRPDAGKIIGSVPGRKIRLMMADDHAVVRQGIANLLSGESDIEIVGAAANGQQAVDLATKLLPDVILMDMSMPVLSGVEATRIIHSRFPEICIIGLSMFEETEKAQAMREAGAANYLTKSGPAEDLIHAVRTGIRPSQKSFSTKSFG